MIGRATQFLALRPSFRSDRSCTSADESPRGRLAAEPKPGADIGENQTAQNDDKNLSFLVGLF
jgi:hypothetical protein